MKDETDALTQQRVLVTYIYWRDEVMSRYRRIGAMAGDENHDTTR